MDVGIRELRTNLAAIMDAVDRGTVVTITHRGKPRATIQPIEATVETTVERGIREGWLHVGPGYYRPRGDRRPTIQLTEDQSRRVWEAFLEDRADDR